MRILINSYKSITLTTATEFLFYKTTKQWLRQI